MMPRTMIAVAEWWIADSFRHTNGVTYSPGEPPPAMTTAQAEELRRLGKLVRAGEAPGAAALEHVLEGDDLQVLRRIRRERPAQAVLQAVLQAAREQGRSLVLLEALAIAAREPAPLEGG